MKKQYKVITYQDSAGNDEIKTYIYDLAQKQNSKDSRVKLNKIMEYIGKLATYGVTIGKPAIDKITGTDLWELRPFRDRIFFAYWKNDIFILLHHFVKKTQKTPPHEIEQAQRNLTDFLERNKD